MRTYKLWKIRRRLDWDQPSRTDWTLAALITTLLTVVILALIVVSI